MLHWLQSWCVSSFPFPLPCLQSSQLTGCRALAVTALDLADFPESHASDSLIRFEQTLIPHLVHSLNAVISAQVNLSEQSYKSNSKVFPITC